MLDFLAISWVDVLDIALVALLIFLAFKWMRGSSAMNIFIIVISLYVFRVIASSLGMKMITTLIDMVFNLGLLALIVIFQPEVRRFLVNFGKRYSHLRNGALSRVFKSEANRMNSLALSEICEACRDMSAEKVGALIVITRQNQLEDIVETGDVIDAKINRRLIRNLFFKNSPLHDGAVILTDDRVVAARCTLPITQREDIPPQFGMRHKAAIGMSEQSDACIIVVSEETGGISLVSYGVLTEVGSISELRLLLDKTDNGQN
ncbi:MAG: diadenylate cyclase CdaA [Bacteroidales bacterium]|nr:diadenylate cyclase CdaA [Bacteroidales bacterium]